MITSKQYKLIRRRERMLQTIREKAPSLRPVEDPQDTEPVNLADGAQLVATLGKMIIAAQDDLAKFGGRGMLRSAAKEQGRLDALWDVARRAGVHSLVKWYIDNHRDRPLLD